MRNERLRQAGTAPNAPRSLTGLLELPRQVDGYQSSMIANAKWLLYRLKKWSDFTPKERMKMEIDQLREALLLHQAIAREDEKTKDDMLWTPEYLRAVEATDNALYPKETCSVCGKMIRKDDFCGHIQF